MVLKFQYRSQHCVLKMLGSIAFICWRQLEQWAQCDYGHIWSFHKRSTACCLQCSHRPCYPRIFVAKSRFFLFARNPTTKMPPRLVYNRTTYYKPEFGLSGQPQLSVYDLDCLQIGFLNYWRYAGLFFEEGVGGQGTHQVE